MNLLVIFHALVFLIATRLHCDRAAVTNNGKQVQDLLGGCVEAGSCLTSQLLTSSESGDGDMRLSLPQATTLVSDALTIIQINFYILVCTIFLLLQKHLRRHPEPEETNKKCSPCVNPFDKKKNNFNINNNDAFAQVDDDSDSWIEDMAEEIFSSIGHAWALTSDITR